VKSFFTGIAVGLTLMFGVARACEGPPPAPLVYTEFVVDTIVNEPDTVVQFVERIVYREVEPEYVATQPGGAEDRVEEFCTPDTVVEIVQGDTVYVKVPTLFVASAVRTTDPWLWGRQDVTVYGFDNAGDRREYAYHSFPGWQFATGNGVTFQEPRLGSVKRLFRIAVPFILGFATNEVIR
jgi:hypothetical protein